MVNLKECDSLRLANVKECKSFRFVKVGNFLVIFIFLKMLRGYSLISENDEI